MSAFVTSIKYYTALAGKLDKKKGIWMEEEVKWLLFANYTVVCVENPKEHTYTNTYTLGASQQTQQICLI